MKDELNSLRQDLDTLNGSMNNLSMWHKKQTTAELAHLQPSLNSIQSSLTNQTGQFNNKLDDLSSKMDTLDTSLYQHQKQMTAELAHLQTSLNSTNSKLDSLMATTSQLSFDHQEIQTNISDVQCMDTQQNLQYNFRHLLETPKNNSMFTPKKHTCGGTEGWRRIAYLDMTDSHTTCPCGWKLTGYCKRSCGRVSTGYRTCSSATFPVRGGEYNRICGRIKAYQWGATHAFRTYHVGQEITIDGTYVSGVSVTHGIPRNHIWTFVAGLSEGLPASYFDACPCDSTRTIRIPPFVGNDYFCESGVNEAWNGNRHYAFHHNDILWDGEDCQPSSTCCSQNNPPYFTKHLPTPTTDDIEARICLYDPLRYGNLAVELVELYVQ